MKLGIILPSRNRPAGLKRMVASLLDNAAKPDRVTIYAGLDADDPTLPETEGIANVERVIRAPETTVAKMIDNLSLQAEQACDATLRMDDDFICETRGWDDNAECMTGLGLWRLDDPTHGAHFMSFACMSSEMAGWLRQAQGFVHAPWFPFWFTDTWLNEIGDMAGMKGPLDIRVTQPEGRGVTHGLRDIKFWAQFFDGFRLSRAMVAKALICDGYPDGVLKLSALLKLQDRMRECALNMEKLKTPEFIEAFEKKAEGATGTASERYLKAKAEAEAMIRDAHAKQQEQAA